MAKQQFSPLRAAAIDGRTHNVFYRQTQLQKLHKALITNAEAFVSAIVSDSGNTRGEAQIEYSLALTELRERYVELKPKEELELEYAIAKGSDATERRVGFGFVIIKATADHTLFFSVVAPLSAAIAAGNCVIVQIDNNLRSLPTLLKNVLKEALDSDTFDIVQQPITDTSLLSESLQVVQKHDTDDVPTLKQLASYSKVPTAVIVDRTADLEKAAQAIIKARFGFKGRSPYAPDVVLVNEFVKKDFVQALLRHSASVENGVGLENGALEKQKTRDSGLKDLVSGLQRNGDVRVLAQETGRAILDIKQRSPQILNRKIKEPCLIIHGVKSLDDAIDLLNSDGKELLAAYHWAEPTQAKYLSQFVSAQASFVNNIPTEILVGPAFPVSHPINLSTRYPAALFSKPAPSFVTQSSTGEDLDKALLASSSSERAAALNSLQQAALSDLPVKKRNTEMRAAFGFFEQAMVSNLSVILLSTITVVSGVVYWLKHYGVGR